MKRRSISFFIGKVSGIQSPSAKPRCKLADRQGPATAERIAVKLCAIAFLSHIDIHAPAMDAAKIHLGGHILSFGHIARERMIRTALDTRSGGPPAAIKSSTMNPGLAQPRVVFHTSNRKGAEP
jgi:hypothetical protein